MARSQDELRQLFNAGTATDADMDEYINAGYDYNALGPKSKALYDQRKAAMPTTNTSTVDLNKVVPEDPIPQGALGQSHGYSGDPNTVRKELRSKYASDNEAYKEELKRAGIEAASDPNSKYKMKSIQQAYYDGDIDKTTRDYMMIDTIAKFARNMGKDIGNVAAAYSGGTVNNEREGSVWDARNAEMLKQGISSEAATVEDSDKQMERAMQRINQKAGNLKNEQAGYTLSAARKLEDAYKNAKSQTEKNILAALISDVSDGNISEGALAALAGEGAVKDVMDWWNSGRKSDKLTDAENAELALLEKKLKADKAAKVKTDPDIADRIDQLRAKAAGTETVYGPGGTVNGEFPMQ